MTVKIAAGIREQVDKFLEARQPSMEDALDIQFEEISPDRVSGTMPVDQRTKQPFGILHGGASVVLAETLASIASWANIDPEKQLAVGMEINANHLRPVSNGRVRGEATPIHKGRKSFVWQIHIRDENDKLICISRCTVAIVDK